MRQIVLDTETTGLDAAKGDRIIEIGCVELINLIPTGQTFHCYINPERAVHPDAVKVHGLTDAFLSDKPLFAAVADRFLAFVGDDPIIIHNAAFDTGFLNMELGRLGRAALVMERILDTLSLARRKHPGGSNSLDALCARYGIDNSRRTRHGALLDAEILAEVYAELSGGRQAGLDLSRYGAAGADRRNAGARRRPIPLAPRLTRAEWEAHEAFIRTLGDKPLWLDYRRDEPEATETLVVAIETAG